jgi:GT2 family glycosyltransferase
VALEKCLDSLASLDYPRERYETIVVDDGSSASPAQIVGHFTESMRVRLITIAHAGPAAARNAGVSKANGDNLAFIDDDCRANPKWLDAMSARLDAHHGSVIGGRVHNALPQNMYSRTSQGLQEYLYHWYHEAKRGELRFFTTNNLTVSRQTFETIGCFDASFPFASEDRDWCDRALHAGFELVYAKEAVVSHAHDLSLGTFLRQHYRYGQGALRFHSARAARRGVRVKLEPASFYSGMVSAPFSMRESSALRESILLLASQSASLAGFARELARRWPRSPSVVTSGT